MRWMMMCAVAAATLTAGLARAQGLFPAREDQRVLRQEYLAAGRAYEREAMLEAYRAGGGQDERWDGLVERFIDGYAAELAGGDAIEPGEVVELAREVLSTPCPDRGIIALCATVILEANPRSKAKRAAAAALSPRRPIEHCAQLRLAAARASYHALGGVGNEMLELSADSLVSALAAPGLSELEERWIVNEACTIAQTMHADGAELMAQALRDASGVSRWAAMLVSGAVEIRLGWDARGTGFADTVTEEGAATFARHMAAARGYLEEAYQLQPSRPEAAAYMITVAMGESAVDELSAWFSRSVAAQLDYLPAYSRYQQALRPRWHGSMEHLLRFAEACAATGRFDTVVPLMAYEAIIQVGEDIEDMSAPFRVPELYAAIRDVLRRTARQCAEPGVADGCRERLAAIAWQAGVFDDAAELVQRIRWPEGGALPRRAWTEFDQIRSDVALHSSGAPAVQDALAAEQRENWAEAEQLFATALADEAAGVEAELRWALRDRFAVARFHQAYVRRRPVALPLDADLAGWRRHSGAWRVEGGVLVGRACGAGAEIHFAAPLGDYYLVEATVDIDKDSDDSAFSGGVILDGEPFKATGARYDSVRVSMNGVHTGFRDNAAGTLRRLHDGPIRLRIERDGEELKVWHGEQLIAHGRTVNTPWLRTGRLGFGIFKSQASKAEVRISDVCVTRLVRGGEEAPGF